MHLQFCALLILVITVSFGTANTIPNNEVNGVNQTKVDNWVLNFYDKCGETEVIDIESASLVTPSAQAQLCFSSSGEGLKDGVGPYCGDEVVKRCVGDRPGCIEKRNCDFAIAVTETAYYSYTTTTTTTTTTEPPPTTTPPATTTPAGTTVTDAPTTTADPTTTTTTQPPFELWTRKIRSHRVKILDACHFNSLANDEVHAQKFVGVGIGVFDDQEAVDCDKDPSFENIRAYFFVSSLSACDMKPELPLFPYQDVNTTLDMKNPTNEFTISVTNWKSRCRGQIKPHIPPTAKPVTLNSDFMKYFLVHYYGTQNYTQFHDYTYTDVGGFIGRNSATGNLFLAPPPSQRATTAEPTTPEPTTTTESSSAIVSASSYVIATLLITAIKSIA